MTDGRLSVRTNRALQLLDALTLILAAVCVSLLTLGSWRTTTGGRIIVLTWQQALFAAAAIIAVRHAWVTSPSIVTSVSRWRTALASRPSVTDALLAFWLTRPTVLLVGLLAVATIGMSGQAELRRGSALDALANRFDAGWYAGIAAEGYAWQHRFDRQQNIAFFPAYPLLLRAGGVVTGALRPGIPQEAQIELLAWTGTAISLIAFFFACIYFSRIAREFLDPPRASAAVLLLSAYPFSIFYSAAYTESLFLLAALGAWDHFRRGQWVRSALWGLLVGLTRPNGFLLSLPLALLAVGVRESAGAIARSSAPRAPQSVRLAVAMTPIAGMLLFTIYLYSLTRVWFAWARMHGAWGRVLGSTAIVPDSIRHHGDGLVRAVIESPYQTMNALGLLFALSLTYPVFRRVGVGWGLFVVATILPPLAAGGVLSMGRVTSTLFPLFLAFAAVLSVRSTLACAAAFGLLQGIAAVLFFTWRALY